MSGGTGARRRGFTLIEMLVVIAIIAILAGLVLGGVTASRRHAKAKAAEATIHRLGLALTRYETDYGDYPDSKGMDGVAGCAHMTEALLSKGKGGPYIEANEFRFGDPDNTGQKVILDEWGHPFRYIHHRHYKSNPNRLTYRMYSAGADGREDTGDDIRNWADDQPAE